MDKALETMLANLQKNTGKSLEEWVAHIRDKGLSKHGEILAYLKSEHQFGHGFANMVAHRALKSDAVSLSETTDLVAEQFSGKEELLAIYRHLIGEIQKFGPDVELAPKKAYVSLRRNKQFALIQPSTKTRLDIGLSLKGVDPAGRLEAAGSFNAMCSHRIRIEQASDITLEVLAWLRQAYDAA